MKATASHTRSSCGAVLFGMALGLGAVHSANGDYCAENFSDAQFPDNYWFVGDSNSSSGYDYWDDVQCLTGWMAACADAGDTPNPCDGYDHNMDAYMYVEAQYLGLSYNGTNKLMFDVFIDAEDYFDYFTIRVEGYISRPSHGGGSPNAVYSFSSSDTYNGLGFHDWYPFVAELDYTFDPCYYVRVWFKFHSDDSVIDGAGAFVDDICFCCSSNTKIYPIEDGFCTLARWWRDADNDGYGNPDNYVDACDPPSGYVSNDDDCDDNCASCHPGGTEVCDTRDNDCDEQVDEAGVCEEPDSDGDGDPDDTDCDDSNPSIHHGATEVCDAVDNDCDGRVDEGGVCEEPDSDGDGDPDDTDCDDTNPSIHLGAPEVCDDGVDNDCDGLMDCDDSDCPADVPPCAPPPPPPGCGDGDCSEGETNCNCPTDCGQPAASETDCENGIDDDCDGKVDSADSDCVQSPCEGHGGDSDGDGKCDDADNCPNDPNPTQADCDNDGVGDACDEDICPSDWCKRGDGRCDECGTDTDCPVWYPDNDGDGAGNDAQPFYAATPPAGYVSNGLDPVDIDPTIRPAPRVDRLNEWPASIQASEASSLSPLLLRLMRGGPAFNFRITVDDPDGLIASVDPLEGAAQGAPAAGEAIVSVRMASDLAARDYQATLHVTFDEAVSPVTQDVTLRMAVRDGVVDPNQSMIDNPAGACGAGACGTGMIAGVPMTLLGLGIMKLGIRRADARNRFGGRCARNRNQDRRPGIQGRNGAA